MHEARENRHAMPWLMVFGCLLGLLAFQGVIATEARAADQSQVTLDDNEDGTKTLHYEALVNQINEVTVEHDLGNGTYVVTDTNINVGNAGGSGCTIAAGTTWTCPAADVTKILINVGGAADVVDLCQSVALGTACTSNVGVDATVDGGGAGDELTGAGSPSPLVAHGTTTLFGGPGRDTLNAGFGGTTIVSYDEPGRTQAVEIHLPGLQSLQIDGNGEPGESDTLGGVIRGAIGGPGNDLMIGNFLGNTFQGGTGDDTIVGLGGEDTATYEDHAAGVTVHADTQVTETGFDADGRPTVSLVPGTASGAPGESDLVGDDIESIVGGSGNDTLTGTSRPDSWSGVFVGGAGNDSFDGGPGPDVFEGGDGFDTVTYASDPDRTGPVKVTMDGSNADDGSAYDQPNPAFPGPRDTVSDDVESVVGTAGNDVLNGSPNADTLIGGAGEDTIDGNGGNDSLQGGTEDDTIKGAGGDDAIDGGSGNDSLGGGDGNDSLGGGDGNDSLDGGSGADSFSGGNGSDVGDFSSRLVNVSVSADAVPGDGQAGENDNVGADVEGLLGGSGDDSLSGNGGAGSFNGGPGSDSIDGGGGPDSIMGGTGFDTADYSGRGGSVAVNLGSPGGDGEAGENDAIEGDIERVVGGSGPDSLIGGPGADALEGSGGDDFIAGADGQDKLDGGAGNDTLNGDGGNDTLGGGEGNDAVNGGDGNDATGGDGGDDIIDGGPGADNFRGGAGNDTASYSSRPAALTINFDGLSNDGSAGEGDNVESDVESLASGSGNDLIDSSGDGNNGTINCAGGTDTLTSDPGDVAISCESHAVDDSARVKVSITTSSAKLSKAGSVSIKLACSQVALDPCAGNLTLSSSARASRGSRKKRLGRLGGARFSIAPGKTKSVRIKLSKKARKTVRRKGKLRTRATATASGLVTVSKTITISGPKKKGRN